MKLEFWKIPELATHQGFAIIDVAERAGDLEVRLRHLEDQTLNVSVTFRNYLGFMGCDEFGMERYVVDSPAHQGRGGGNFFTATESEFRAFLERGAAQDTGALMSFVLVDTDRWIEIVTMNGPKVDVSTPGAAARH